MMLKNEKKIKLKNTAFSVVLHPVKVIFMFCL